MSFADDENCYEQNSRQLPHAEILKLQIESVVKSQHHRIELLESNAKQGCEVIEY